LKNENITVMRKIILSLVAESLMFLILVLLPAGSLKGQEKLSVIVIAGLQMQVTGNIEKNRDQIIAGIKKAAEQKASFLVTPEGSLSGYTADFDQQGVTAALAEITSAAKRSKVGLMLGTCFKETLKGKEYCYNQVRIYDPDGSFAGAHSKILRCSGLALPGTGEMVDYVEGELRTFEWKGSRFGVLICNDMWATPGYTTIPNPYLPWKLKQMGAQFIIHCINSGTVQKYRPFHESSVELWASALGLPIMEVNAAQGNEAINARSGLVGSSGERSVSVPDTGEQFFTVSITPAGSKAGAGH
jgi:predicted amidohydrolase